MRKALKIGLITLAALGIGVVIWLTLLYQKNDIKEVTVDDSYFTAQIKTQADKEISGGSSFSNIMHAYNSMMQEVGDAVYLENIDAREASNCRKMLAYGYAPKLTDYARKCFRRHEWNVNIIDTLRNEAQNLINAGILPSDSHDLPKLHDIVKTVNDYHAAVAATKVGNITTVSAAQAAISHANSYKHAPLTNCRSLATALDAVPAKVKDSLAKNIASACQHHKASTDDLLKRISDYEDYFGYNPQLDQERQKLLTDKQNNET
ncbi:MAG: hypothetical protein J6X22_07350 [Muribaculaceae bacterium]|nr:hypothetical protein [Muribaculaceae bacterium]